MSIQNENTLQAVALVDGDGTLLGGQGIASVIRVSVGTYSITLDSLTAEGERVVGLQSAFGWHEFSWVTPTTLVVETFDELFVDTDSRFSIEVHRLPTGS